MPTNEERRECAKKLREIELVKLPDAGRELEEVHKAIGCWFGQDHFSQEFNDRLADLIEPEPERTCKFIHHECRHPNEKDACGKYQDCEWSCAKDSLYCSSCDKCVAVSFGRQLKVKKYSFCPYCGAKVVE